MRIRSHVTGLQAALVGLVAAAMAFGLMSCQGSAAFIDDAYITFRTARNLASGHGLVYNPGEPVLATSTPLYAAILGALGAVWGADRIPDISFGINVLFVGTAAVGVFLFVRRLGEPVAVAVFLALLVATNERLIDVSAGGMETPFYVALCLLFLLMVHHRLGARSGLLGAMLAATRPEAVLLAGVGGVWLAARDRRALCRFLVAGAACGLPWMVYAFLVYKTPIPQSLAAKSALAFLNEPWTALRVLASQASEHAWGLWLHLASGLHVLRNTLEPWRPQLALGAGLNLLCITVAAWRWWHHDLCRATLAFAAAYFLAFATKNPVMMPWYIVPLEVFYTVFVGAGACRAFRSIASGRLPRQAAILGEALPLALLAGAQASHYGLTDPVGNRGRWLAMAGWDREREVRYLELGREIAATRADARVAAPEIGALGWTFTGPILDTLGLASPEAVSYYLTDAPVRNCAVPDALLASERPDYVVAMTLFLSGCDRERGDGWTRYRRIRKVPMQNWGDVTIEVWERVGGE